jgi:hypothetical protein
LQSVANPSLACSALESDLFCLKNQAEVGLWADYALGKFNNGNNVAATLLCGETGKNRGNAGFYQA